MGDLVFHSSRQNTSNRHFYYREKNQIYLGMLGNYFHQTKLEPIFFPLRLAFLSALPVHMMNFHYYVSIHEQIRLFFGSLVTTAE